MKEVDYAKLSEQYGGFLIAAGGVSITILTLLLGLRCQTCPAIEGVGAAQTIPAIKRAEVARLFLVAALIVSTVSCFAGAHMMAETAAFFSHLQEKLPGKRPPQMLLGQRLFVMATAHIFIAIGLIIFASVLLPTATGPPALAAAINPISQWVFGGVVMGALCWMLLAATDRTPRWHCKRIVITVTSLVGLACGILFWYPYWFPSIESVPKWIFIPIVILAAISLIYFGITFKGITKLVRIPKGIAWEFVRIPPPKRITWKFVRIALPNFWHAMEVGVFGFAITFSYASLLFAYLRIMQLNN